MTQHQCLHAKRQQLVRELNQVIDEELAYAKTLDLNNWDAFSDEHFCFLVSKECNIQNQIDHIDSTDCASY